MFKDFIAKISKGQSLNHNEAQQAFDIMMSGQATSAQIGAFLMGLRIHGETIEEISGAVSVMRDKMLPVQAPDDAIDIVGTGGDAKGTHNISTCAALVTAACGVPVAKHGNRALSSKSGAADTLTALGVQLDISADKISECIEKAGIGFMFAPAHHLAMKHVAAARVELGTRTIFNLLGPLSNPASVKYHMIGVFAPEWVIPLAEVLRDLGAKRAWVVHGTDGLDEITTTGPTTVAELSDGKIQTFTITPEEVGIARANLDDLLGGDPNYNAAALREVLSGKSGAYRDIVGMNAGAALVVAGLAQSLSDGIEQSFKAIDSGKAEAILETLITVSNHK